MAQARKTKIEKLLEDASKLTPEERAELRKMGVNMPIFGEDQAREGSLSVYGYKCKGCGDIALEFVGSQFAWRDGSTDPKPDPQIPMSEQPIMQSRQGGSIANRTAIRCQCCGTTIHTTHGYPDPRLFVLLEEHHRQQEALARRRRSAIGAREDTRLPQSELMRQVDPESALAPHALGVTSEYNDETSLDGVEMDEEALAEIRESSRS